MQKAAEKATDLLGWLVLSIAMAGGAYWAAKLVAFLARL